MVAPIAYLSGDVHRSRLLCCNPAIFESMTSMGYSDLIELLSQDLPNSVVTEAGELYSSVG